MLFSEKEKRRRACDEDKERAEFCSFKKAETGRTAEKGNWKEKAFSFDEVCGIIPSIG